MSYPVIPDPQKIVSVSDLQSQACVYSGWLRKRGKLNAFPGAKKLFPWSKRFIVLCDGCMYSFANERSSKENGSFSLYGYNSVYRAPDVPQSEALWAFKVVHAQQEYKTYVLSAASEPDMKEWMKQIKLQMMRANNMVLIAETMKPMPKSNMSFEDIESDIYGDSETVNKLENVHVKAKLQSEESEGDDEDSDGDEFYQEVANAHFKLPTTRPIEPVRRLPAELPRSHSVVSDDDQFIYDDQPSPSPKKSTSSVPKPASRAAPVKPPAPVKSLSIPDIDELYINNEQNAETIQKTAIPSGNATKSRPILPPASMNDDQELYIYGDEASTPPVKTAPVKTAPVKTAPVKTAPVSTPPYMNLPHFNKASTERELYIYDDEVRPAVTQKGDMSPSIPSSKAPVPPTDRRMSAENQRQVQMPRQNSHGNATSPPPRKTSHPNIGERGFFGSDTPPSSPATHRSTNQNRSSPPAGVSSSHQDIVDNAMFLGDSDMASKIINDIAEDGVYLIRQGNDGWVLVLFACDKTRKYRITCKDNKFHLSDSKHFESIGELVSNYTQHRLPIGVRLITPYRKHPAHS